MPNLAESCVDLSYSNLCQPAINYQPDANNMKGFVGCKECHRIIAGERQSVAPALYQEAVAGPLWVTSGSREPRF